MANKKEVLVIRSGIHEHQLKQAGAEKGELELIQAIERGFKIIQATPINSNGTGYIEYVLIRNYREETACSEEYGKEDCNEECCNSIDEKESDDLKTKDEQESTNRAKIIKIFHVNAINKAEKKKPADELQEFINQLIRGEI